MRSCAPAPPAPTFPAMDDAPIATRGLALTASQAAERLGVSISTVRRWTDAGHLRGYRTPGGQRRFTAEQLDAFLASLQPRMRDS